MVKGADPSAASIPPVVADKQLPNEVIGFDRWRSAPFDKTITAKD